MFQFTKSTIINGKIATDVKGNALVDDKGQDVVRYAASADNKSFRVFGAGNYKKENILSVYKREGTEGERCEIKVVVPASTKGEVIRLTTVAKLDGTTRGDYADFLGNFTRPLVTEILSSGTAATDAQALADSINLLGVQYGASFLVAQASGSSLTLKAKETAVILSAKLELVHKLDSLASEIEELAESTTVKEGKIGFGDTQHMFRAVSLRTIENTKAFEILNDEKPIIGDLYNQYTLRYKVDSGEDCVWNGDKKSVTTHVFWVNNNISSEFETELKKVFKNVEPVTDVPANNKESKPEAPASSSSSI